LFKVDSSSRVPLYLQLKENIRHLIASGSLAPSDRLPTVRQLAVDLAINPNTVARVYAELTAEGYLEARQGSGTYVRPVAANLRDTRRLTITDRLRSALREALNLGYTPDELASVVVTEIEALARQRMDAGSDEKRS